MKTPEQYKKVKEAIKKYKRGQKNNKNGVILYTEREREEFERGKIEGFNKGAASRQKEIDELKINMTRVMLEYEVSVNNSKFNEGIEAAKELIWKYRFDSSMCLAAIVEELENLKKT